MLPVAVESGIDAFSFWNYTLGEILVTIEAYRNRLDYNQKQMLMQVYLQSKLIAEFMNKSLNGKRLPKFQDVFPGVIKEPEFNWEAYEAQFLNYADTFNKQRGVR